VNNPQPEREASADIRTATAQLRALYLELVRNGFSDDQALRIIGFMLAGKSS
jgi:hypothetical protein